MPVGEAGRGLPRPAEMVELVEYVAGRQKASAVGGGNPQARPTLYEEAQPLVSDQEYDHLYRELLDLEQAHPELQTADSPSQRVGGAPLPHFTSVAHALPMQSLDNTYSATELEAFYDRIQKALEGEKLDFVIEPKIDGVAVSARYEKGKHSCRA